jgi:ribonuclease inhibitor
LAGFSNRGGGAAGQWGLPVNVSTFDFNNITSNDEFFRAFEQVFGLSNRTISDLDLLWETVTEGAIPLPQAIEFVNLNESGRRRFGALILLFEEAEEELVGLLRFNVQA